MPARKTATRKAATKKTAKPRRWSAAVTTDSTHPPEGLFNQSAATIARTLASKKVSPKGPGSGMRMLTFYINRAGHNLSKDRLAELKKAKELLSKRVAKARAQAKAA
jgi:hypothetical protein